MDRIHAYLPGWDVPKLDPSYFTEHFGFVSDFLAECWSQLRRTSRLDVTQGRLEWGSQLSGRDRKAANNTVNGLLKLLWPDPDMEVPDDALAWAAELALEMRRRVKEATGVHRCSRVREGRPQLQRRRVARDGRVLRRVGEAPARMESEASSLLRQCEARRRGPPGPDPTEVVVARLQRVTTPWGLIGGRFEVEEVLGSGGSRRSTACATPSKARSGRSNSSTTPPDTTQSAERSAPCERSTTRTSSR